MRDYFTQDARSLIARALVLAQQCGSDQVLPDHLLIGGSPLALQKTGLSKFKERVESLLAGKAAVSQCPEFSTEVLQVFERAFLCSRGQVDEFHLLLSIELKTLNCGDEDVGFVSLFSPQLVQVLEDRGVRVKRLVERLGGLDLLTTFDADYFQTEAGRQILDLLPGLQQAHLFHLPLLLMMLSRPGPVSRIMSDCGMSEPILIELMTDLSRERVDELLNSFDLEIVPELEEIDERLGRAARLALGIGWNCAGRGILQPQNLLDGLLCADMLCHPGRGATQVLHKLGVLGFAHAATRKMVLEFDVSIRALRLSPESARALVESGAVCKGVISTEHLLYGLSKCNLAEMNSNGITPDKILPYLAKED